jgi:hypothetical protein
VKAPLKYAVTGSAVVLLAVAVLWPFLDSAGRQGVLLAAAIALTVQVGAFWALMRLKHKVNGFLAVWAGGTLLRMLVVAAVAVFAIRTEMDGAVPMLLSLAGFFFGLLLLEPMYFRSEPDEVT